jgi:leader peptidase (prepilin peptidase)/N-methyltransferase
MLAFLIGLIFGSFFNTLIYRLEKGESFLFGKSKCPKCNHPLSFLDLIPIISYLFLKGKCRYCKEKISLFYPIGEFLTGILFLSFYLRFKFLFENFNFKIQAILPFLYYFSFLIILYLLAVYDFRTKNIPAILVFFGFLIWILFFIISFFYKFPKISFLDTINSFFDFFIKSLPFYFENLDFILNFLIAVLFLLASFIGLVGEGDFLVILFIGLFLKTPELLFSIFLAGFLGSLYSLPFIFLKKYNLKSEIPFVPFLFLSNWFIICFGNEISKIIFKI